MEYRILEYLKDAVKSLEIYGVTDASFGLPNVAYTPGNDLFFELSTVFSNKETQRTELSSYSFATGCVTVSVPANEGIKRIDRIAEAVEELFGAYNRTFQGFVYERPLAGAPEKTIRTSAILRSAKRGGGAVVGDRYKVSVFVEFLIERAV